MLNTSTTTFYNKNEKIWHGKKLSYKYGSENSLGSVALEFLLAEPNLDAQICHQSGRTITNMEMAKLSIQAALYVKNQLQLQQGEIIGMCVTNSDYVCPVVLGCLMAGLSISTLDPSFDVDGIRHIYSQTRPKIMFCDGGIYEKVRKAFDECGLSSIKIYLMHEFSYIDNVPTVKELFVHDVNVYDFRVPPLKYGSNQRAFVVCSSGTTGPPKAVCISHAIILSVESFTLLHRKYLCFSSLYWLSGIISLFCPIISHGTRIISEKPFSPEDFFNIVQMHKVHDVVGPPSHISLALASDQLFQSNLSSIENYACGGSSVSYSMVEKFKKFIPNAKFTVIYGMTESVLKVALGECEPSNSVGFLAENREVKIIDDDGHRLPSNMRGEICIRGPYPWEGYYNNEEATKAVYDNEQWYHSGDVGYINEGGKLFVVDRKKDILKYNNFHFSPTMIEKVINDMSAILESCVVGIPDETFGFLPAAAIIRQPSSGIKESEIYQYVKNHMQHFEQLRGGVYFVDTLPRTPSGKTLRREVTKICHKLYKDMNELPKVKLNQSYLSKQTVRLIS